MMGYTNYWQWKTPIADANKLAEWSSDVQHLLDYMITPGRVLPQYIYQFNSRPHSDHLFTIRGLDGSGQPIITPTEVAFNGDASTEEDLEPFIITLQELEAPNPFAFCKTGLNPYDLVVICALVRFVHYFPDSRLGSDGEEEAIQLGVTVCKEVFGDNATPVLIDPEDV
jgi:hypothetical protein